MGVPFSEMAHIICKKILVILGRYPLGITGIFRNKKIMLILCLVTISKQQSSTSNRPLGSTLGRCLLLELSTPGVLPYTWKSRPANWVLFSLFDAVESVHLADCVGNRFCSAPLAGLHVPHGIPWCYDRRMGSIWQILPSRFSPRVCLWSKIFYHILPNL
jgi:hypothetical protein